MSRLEYPKIDTLYERKPNGKVDVTRLKRLEFALINEWKVTEKLNGRNIRVMLTSDGEVTYAGRHDEKNFSDQSEGNMNYILRNKTWYDEEYQKYLNEVTQAEVLSNSMGEKEDSIDKELSKTESKNAVDSEFRKMKRQTLLKKNDLNFFKT